MRMVKLGALLALSLGLVPPGALAAAPPTSGTKTEVTLPKPGAKVPLGKDHYFVYGFTQPPKLGNAIMRVEIFTLNGQRDRSFTVHGDADMPSMRGAHSSGSKPFVLSAKGAYLLPMQLVMPGDWEVKLSFEKNGTTVLLGLYQFDL